MTDSIFISSLTVDKRRQIIQIESLTQPSNNLIDAKKHPNIIVVSLKAMGFIDELYNTINELDLNYNAKSIESKKHLELNLQLTAQFIREARGLKNPWDPGKGRRGDRQLIWHVDGLKA